MKHLLTLFALLATSLAFGQESCPNVYDYNDNNTIDIEDFLGILGLFADDDTDDDGIWDSQDDCIDLEACNYAASPSEPCAYLDVLGECGGGCEGDGDGDGICDDEDDCVGVVDECGVCNGPGPTEVVIEDITILYDSLYAEQIDEWWVFEVGDDTTFSYECAPSFSQCGAPFSYQGYDYATVLIGEQCWFAENLRSENYMNGDAIPSNLSDSDWADTISGLSGAVAVRGEGNSNCQNYSPDGNSCDETWSLNEYGRLYNWYAVDDTRGLCPSGWHVPTDEEWTVMTDYLGGWSAASDQMKSSYGWPNEAEHSGNGTNSSGFSGLPGGDRKFYGEFGNNVSGVWWSSSPDGPYAWYRKLTSTFFNQSVFRNGTVHREGLSVRCMKDVE